MNENKNYDELEQLTSLDDASVEEIAYKYPVLDDAAKKRIEALCMKKMNMTTGNKIKENKNNITMSSNDEVTFVEEVSSVKHIPWYRRPVLGAAASVALVIGIGALAISSFGNFSGGSSVITTPGSGNVDVEATTTTTSATEPSSEETSTEPPTEEDDDNLVTNGFNIYDYPDYVTWIKTQTDKIPNNYPEYKTKDDIFFSLVDLDSDGTPEMLIYLQDRLYNAIDDEIKLPDTIGGCLTSNFSCENKLCEGNVIIRSQSNPPYVYNTIYKYNGYENEEVIAVIVHDRSDIDSAENCYRYDQLDYSVDVSDDHAISKEEAKAIMDEYKPIIPEKIAITKVK